MELAVKASAAGICAALMGLIVKRSNPELALALTIAACAVVLSSALGLLDAVAEAAELARDMSGLSGAVLSPVLRCVAIGVITKLGADVCRDAGSAAAASAVELSGAAAALYTALPLIKTLLRMVEGLI